MRTTVFMVSVIQGMLAGYGVYSQNYTLMTVALAMLFLHCADEIVTALKGKNAN